MRLLLCAVIFTVQSAWFNLHAQITIGGNVYGGGNEGNTGGNTTVTVHAGDLNRVFGGARMANVGGRTFVNIDGAHASSSSYTLINYVYGGNDIAGTIGTSATIPTELTAVKSSEQDTDPKKNGIDNHWNTFVRISSKMTPAVYFTQADIDAAQEGDPAYGKTTSDIKTPSTLADDNQKIYIGQLFAGGNGDYTYTEENGKYNITIDGKSHTDVTKPDVGRAYMEVCGGSIVYAYGGGNCATVTDSTVIHVDNPSEVVNSIKAKDGVIDEVYGTELLTNERFEDEMDINIVFSKPSSDEFQIGRFFGGNNKVEMKIRPKWNLLSGKIRNLYSGGNEGDMTNPQGLLLEIPEWSTLVVDNVFGGCRKADVRPMVYNDISKTYVDATHVYNLKDYKFPHELAARVLVRGGDVNNVYGGNDVRGKVYFGNAIGIYTTIRGNVYGGGNGSYPYTDNSALKDSKKYGDYYYNPDTELAKAGVTVSDNSLKSATALNLIRPNAEQVSIRIAGKDEDHKAIIGGSIFGGGNSATLKRDENHSELPDYPVLELKIGSYAFADKVFLGNNGEEMVKTNEEEKDAQGNVTVAEGILRTMNNTTIAGDGTKFNSIDLTDPTVFAEYMEGASMDLPPRVVFDNVENGDPATYLPYSTSIGSLYCGGNVGSMTTPGTTTINFNQKVIIYDKVVGGCNDAYVPKLEDINAEYNGGFIGSKAERQSSDLFEDENHNIKNRLVLNLSSLRIQPKRWTVLRDNDYNKILDANGNEQYVLDSDGNRQLEWNTVDARGYDPNTKTYREVAPLPEGSALPANGIATEDDLNRRLTGGHIYGGCYNSGRINGNVIINLNNTLIDRKILFDEVLTDTEDGEAILYNNSSYTITKRNTGVILDEQGMDVLGVALNTFGGGKGANTEIWGSTTINVNGGYSFQVFGGSEEGVIGKHLVNNSGQSLTTSKSDYVYDENTHEYAFNGKLYKRDDRFSCYVNLCGKNEGVSKKDDQSEEMAECEFMYGGGFFGPVCGNTVINLGKGRIFNSFAGSCNGDILGTAETFIGRQVKAEYKSSMPSSVIGQDVFEEGFPWIRDIVYGANDLGGRILGTNDYKNRVRGVRSIDPSPDFDVIGKVHRYNATSNPNPDVLKASAYVEYLQGRADAIFGGCYGTYDYTNRKFSRYTDTAGEPLLDSNSKPLFFKPRLDNAFVNFRPTYSNQKNVVHKVYGAGQGQSGETDRDKLQNRSYVLIDIPQQKKDDGTDDETFMNYYQYMEVFGTGAWGGVGMGVSMENYNADKDKGSAIIDLMRGKVGAVYGGSYLEGVTRRTLVNVPDGSTILMGSIFGGAYGTETLKPCDVYEGNVEYHSSDAILYYNPPRVGEEGTQLGNELYKGAIYGGNNQERRTIYAKVNIDVPVQQKHYQYGMSKATVYGAGYGERTWAEYTEVNLNRDTERNTAAWVWEVYGGGEAGRVLNAKSVQEYMNKYATTEGASGVDDPKWKAAWTLGGGYDPTTFTFSETSTSYSDNEKTNLNNTSLVQSRTMWNESTRQFDTNKKFNTNVIINEGAYVGNYAYGGGLGKSGKAGSGDVYGTTYIALLGGTVNKDLYAAGTLGGVYDAFGTKNFTASTNAYIQGGTARNIYGGGWKGSVGLHDMEHNSDITTSYTNDIPGETHVVVGKLDGTSFVDGLPAIERNVYAGGEGGAVFGDAYVTMLNGFVGYRYYKTIPDNPILNKIDYIQQGGGYYQEKLHDETWDGDSINRLYDSGCVFGGGYVDNSSVDNTYVKMYGGHVRNSLFGGGEIAAIGRGVIHASGTDKSVRTLMGIYKAGKTNVVLYDGYVHRNVFGGGRGYNNLGEQGSLYSDGYVFGQTEVRVHGGEVGTNKELLKENGNVFGGGDIGYVYSAYEKDGNLYVGIKDGERYDDKYEGYYYRYKTNGNKYEPASFVYIISDPNWVMEGDEYILTEDCKVLIEPEAKVLSEYKQQTTTYTVTDVTINGHTYTPGQYVPIEDLNTLKDKNSDADRWKCLDSHGIIIYNAVFAGGNTASGSATVYANATSVYGNATASIHDVYHRDLITLGTGHTGGLYGDGNLTFVDGYRGLNITNYGTDYYSISKEIKIDEYHALPDREAAYYELKYKCIKRCTDKEGTVYNEESGTSKASTLTADELLLLFKYNDGTLVKVDATGNHDADGTAVLTWDADKSEYIPNPLYWEENGVLPVYAGRLMNSVQRADFCGVFGSRMVMQGAQDRVPEVVDYTNYTINRVREVSLNQQHSTIESDLTLKDKRISYVDGHEYKPVKAANVEDQDPDDYANVDNAVHGNYFGIYNIVNFLGALTSDVQFSDKRRTTSDGVAYKPESESQTYYDWKSKYVKERKRNNGTSLNKVALASGVYLELTTEKSTGTGLTEKDWGYITGVIELDLINVQQGIGGGFVYAKNEHRTWNYNKKSYTTLTALNADAVTRKDFEYTTNGVDNALEEWETSGNFIHSTQTIIDDCYNISGKYSGDDAVPAHYWYIKGSVYVYDQYISAYTGAPNAYSESVEIPLTITAASHGTMKLLNVKPNRYAYYNNSNTNTVIGDGKKIVVNDVEYYKNDPISYWDYFLLSNAEKGLFVEDTYVTIADCILDKGGANERTIPAGTVMLKESTNPNVETYQSLKDSYSKVYHVEKQQSVDFDYVFRSSNNLGHDTGYILTYKVNNPTNWNTWYTEYDDTYNTSAPREKQQAEFGPASNNGPTYHLTSSEGGVLGQREYSVGNLISQETYYTYEGKEGDANYPGITTHINESTDGVQAKFEPGYIVTQQITIPGVNGGPSTHLNPGAAVSKTAAESYAATYGSGLTSPAYICTSTIQLSKTEYIYLDTKMSLADKNNYISDVNTKIAALGTFADASNPTEAEIALLSEANKKKLNELLAIRKDITGNIVPAYYCTKAGKYGGNYYESGKNYRGLEAWSSMSAADREKFEFNYDAFDLLIDKTYGGTEGHKYQYDSNNTTDGFAGANANPAHYSLEQPVDYTAEYNDNKDYPLPNSRTITVKRNGTSTSTNILQKGDELTREVFENELINEQRHYAPINIGADNKVSGTDNTYRVYVVNNGFQIGNTPYAVGQTISSSDYSSLGDSSDKNNVTVLDFSAEGTYYYCRESYPIATNTNVKDIKGTTGSNIYSTGDTVPRGAVINKESVTENPGTENSVTYTGFVDLTNQQKNFTIHGIAPTETSTLFVSRNSDIFDLSTEKIITVIYEYDYEESDASGNISPVSERHVVNIHINFKSGIPTVEDIKAPQIILPGDLVSLREPNVTPGAYEVTGGGWELFEKKGDAESHINGIEHRPVYDPLYWYQDGYYVAYYAKTYLGKTYSNAVQVSVANYHDLKKVMEATDHHYYVDNPDVHRESKIYINNYKVVDENGVETSESKNGLDLLKQLYDLSVLNGSTVDIDANGLITTVKATGEDSPLKGHALLNNHVASAQNLEFFLRSDLDYSAPSGSPARVWTPIANETGECFEGNLHGDGHTVKGLSASLFNHLCGNVYNLGVMGTFTGAGIAEAGSGYVENCWVSTSSTDAKTSAPVFGTPDMTDDTRPYRIVNCYYEEEDDATTTAYTNHNGTYGIPTKKSRKAFYNGEVAYDLNGFYLYKRYCDNADASERAGFASTTNYWKPGVDTPQPALYGSDNDLCSAGYVEGRFADGDFRYAGGSIPESTDRRAYTTQQGATMKTDFYAIWPDDYLFFGQALNYDHMDGLNGRDLRSHQNYPSSINRSGDLVMTALEGNRVYRAPAYFRSSKMGVAHFNQYAVFAKTKLDTPSMEAYKDMTAIDFSGGNGDLERGYQKGLYSVSDGDGPAAGTKQFFPPLLDDDGLKSIINIDLTRNLLAYTSTSTTAATATDGVVSTYLHDEPYVETHSTYHTVAKWDRYADNIHGHWVQKQSTDSYMAMNDHMLVDKNDFNAPIAYSFDTDMRMWYQREPSLFVDRTKGWEAISLPFTAERVTTHQKGEITHFYSGSESSKNNTGTKIGHEYWLRQIEGMTETTQNNVTTATGTFNYPTRVSSGSAGGDKDDTNTFLWDYYYRAVSGHNQKDQNKNLYQEYYSDTRTYDGYPRMAAGTPYIIGFPGVTYYEFDLSGEFVAANTLTSQQYLPAQLEKQTVTFASKPGETNIGISDDETGTEITPTGSSTKYIFKANYLNQAFEAGSANYTLNAEGTGFDKVPDATTPPAAPVADTPLSAFRPYFTTEAVPSPSRPATRSILFSQSDEVREPQEPHDTNHPDEQGSITARPARHKVVVSSTMTVEVEVRILNAAGQTIDLYTLQPGETQETRIANAGVYIVQSSDGRYLKKLAVR